METKRFPHHTRASAPVEANSAFGTAETMFGMAPNLTRKMATAPALAKGYLALSASFDKTSLSPVERQVILLTASRYNGCQYCVGAHSWLADQPGVPEGVIRDQRPIPDDWLEALRQFTHAVDEQRGWVNGAEPERFRAAGYSTRQVLEVVLGVGVKTLSNYTNHIAGTDLDDVFLSHAWVPAEPAPLQQRGGTWSATFAR